MHNDKLTVNISEFLKKFPDNETARIALEQKRWNGSPICPNCGEAERIQTKKPAGYYRCLPCQKVFTIRTGTIFERSHVGLHLWLYAMYLVMTARKGISSLQLSKEIGITQKSAWFLLQRIREVCGNGAKKQLSGVVEADEVYIGGKESNKHAHKKLRAGRGAVGKEIVMGMRERGGRVDASVITSTSSEDIKAKVRESVASGSTLCTDEHPSYAGMPEYEHKVVNHSAKEFVNKMAHTNGIESVWAVLKRGHYGTYHHFSSKHLQRYVNEFTFRLNDGNVKRHTYDRIDAMLDRTEGTRLTYKRLIEK